MTTVGYSHVDLDRVAAESDASGVLIKSGQSMYRLSDYAVANLVFHSTLQAKPGLTDLQKQGLPKNFYTGLEFLYGEKKELSQNSGRDYRLLYALTFTK